MAIQTINLGTYANDGTGDDLRTAFQKVNANFTELNSSDVRGGINLGPAYVELVSTEAASAAGISTLRFAEQATPPFSPGDSINVTGITPSGFNGTHTVTECTTSSVSFIGLTTGPQGAAGTITPNIGTVFFQRNTTGQLEFNSLTSIDNSVTFTVNTDTLNLKANTRLSEDTNPILGGTLNLNGNYVYGGDVQTTIFGSDLRQTVGLVELMLAANAIDINFGTFLTPTGSTGVPGSTGITVDMNGLLNNGFAGAPQVPNVDFGAF